MNNTRLFSLSAAAVLSMAAAESVLAAPHGGLLAMQIPTHHVRLEGTGLQKLHASTFNDVDKFCKALGKTPEPLPVGEKVFSQTRDIYYTLGGTTKHTRTVSFSIKPSTCKLHREETLEIEMRTAAGICAIKPKRKHAAGWCDVGPLIAGKVAQPVQSLSIKPTGKTTMIAGLTCAEFKGKAKSINIEYCIANAGAFTGIPDFSHAHHSGLLLKTATWSDARPDEKITDFEATKVATDIKVGIDVLAPHVTGGFSIHGQGE